MSSMMRGQHPDLREHGTRPRVGRPNTTEAVKAVAIARRRGAATDQLDLLRRTIEGDIIPRLMLTAGTSEDVVDSGSANGSSRIGTPQVVEFTGLLMDGDLASVGLYVDRLMESGATRQDILLDLYAPAARRLGWLWETDACNFAVVTMAMGSLQQALRLMDGRTEPLGDNPNTKSIYLTPGAGEQHSFAIQVLELFFRRAGWDVESEPAFACARICRMLGQRSLDVIGLSISRDCLLDSLASDIQRLRRASRNKALLILVGGRVFVENPGLVASIGADATAPDARTAVLVAESRIAAPAVL